MIERWITLASEILGDYHVFRLRRDLIRSPRDGGELPFYVLETGDWVNIIPITPDGRVVLIRQYRYGRDAVSLEIPGGQVDGEEPAVAAARELLEETGYAGDPPVHLGTVAPNPAIQNNRCHTFLATNVRPVAEVQFDHALVIAAFYFFEQARPRLGLAPSSGDHV
jgi:8-oxo-dGTP pyrophosphatase MutT (NUDIX family)